MESTFAQFPHWDVSAKQEQNVRIALYKVLLKNGLMDKKREKKASDLTELVDKIMNVAGRVGD